MKRTLASDLLITQRLLRLLEHPDLTPESREILTTALNVHALRILTNYQYKST